MPFKRMIREEKMIIKTPKKIVASDYYKMAILMICFNAFFEIFFNIVFRLDLNGFISLYQLSYLLK